MELIMETVRERDMDLLLIESIMNGTIKELLLKSVGLDTSYEVSTIEHSVYDGDGESDIVVVFKNETGSVGVHIEDKIDADARPNQSSRYITRGANAVAIGKYQAYKVVIIAPKQYLETNLEAKNYVNKISYDEIAELFPEGSYQKQLINLAIEKKKKGYTPVEVPAITEFYKELYYFVQKNYPDLTPYYTPDPKGPRGGWTSYKLDRKGMEVQNKEDRGISDLQIQGMCDYVEEFKELNAELLKKYPQVEVTTASKSLAVRIFVDCTVNFREKFSDQIENEIKYIEATRILQELSKEIKLPKIDKKL